MSGISRTVGEAGSRVTVEKSRMERLRETKINILGAGLAGLTAALELSKAGVKSRLISVQASERAQSNLAEGGINACLNVMGEDDHIYEHFEDTMRGGCDLADPNMAAGLCLAAPSIIKELEGYGVPFQREEGKLIQRNFGGQKKKRTAYVKSSTGRMLTAALIDAVRRYECEGLVERLCHHEFRQLVLQGGVCAGAIVYDTYTEETLVCPGPVILAVGGMNGLFEGRTTGTTANTGDAAAVLYAQGVRMANLEMVQYHPTTVQITGKRLLISEAARGEGGRLFYYGEPDKVYFMEEKFGAHGNLMPRDVISREMAACGKEIYLDLTGIPSKTWERKLSDLREEIIHYMAIDPVTTPVPVAPGIHFFMGGILVDESQRTNIKNFYAAGECACAYHGANRLGGNSLLAAIYSGKIAARAAANVSAAANAAAVTANAAAAANTVTEASAGGRICDPLAGTATEVMYAARTDSKIDDKLSEILFESLPVLRTESDMQAGLERIRALKREAANEGGQRQDTVSGTANVTGGTRNVPGEVGVSYCRILLAEAFLMSALARKESRGAHYVNEYPERKEDFRKTTAAVCREGATKIEFLAIPALREEYRRRLYPENVKTK